MSSITATIRVRMEVEVIVGKWGAESTFLTLRDQATREAKQQVQNVITKASSSMRIIGEPKTMHVILEGEMTP